MATAPQLKNAKLISTDTFNAARAMVVSEKRDIVAAASVTYNLATLLGTDAVKYDLTKSQVSVSVLDTEGGSVTNGYFVDAVACAAVGWKENGNIIVANQHQATQNFYIRITVPLKPLA